MVSNTYCVVLLFCFSSCTICCKFLLIVHFWLPLRCSLTFIYERKLKKWWLTIPLISTKQTTTSNLKPFHTKHITLVIKFVPWDRHKDAVGATDYETPSCNLIFGSPTAIQIKQKTNREKVQIRLQSKWPQTTCITKMNDINVDSTTEGSMNVRRLSTSS